jgi:hypothetical protein
MFSHKSITTGLQEVVVNLATTSLDVWDHVGHGIRLISHQNDCAPDIEYEFERRRLEVKDILDCLHCHMITQTLHNSTHAACEAHGFSSEHKKDKRIVTSATEQTTRRRAHDSLQTCPTKTDIRTNVFSELLDVPHERRSIEPAPWEQSTWLAANLGICNRTPAKD